MKKKYKAKNYYFMISNDYDLITKYFNTYMEGFTVPCKYCEKRYSQMALIKRIWK